MNNAQMTAVALCVSWCLMGASEEGPSRLLCEWQREPTAMADPYPEFSWTVPSQSACQIHVSTDPDGNESVWDSGKIEQELPLLGYDGPQLQNKQTYYWQCHIWDADGRALSIPPAQSFIPRIVPRAHYLPSVRTFINFAGAPSFAKDWLDLCFRQDAKQGRPEILTVHYGLVCTMVLPHPSTEAPLTGKAKKLEEFCIANGLTTKGIAEEMFCHFGRDTKVKLHVGQESASCPVETRLCRGWDPANDRNRDGQVDDQEAEDLVNPDATAKHPQEARIPIYYWGPPRDDFVMNVGDPDYRRFMAEVHAPQLCDGWDGIYFDTVPAHVPGPGRSAHVLEYPPSDGGANKWVQDLQKLFAEIKIALPEKLITGNGWEANPMVLDGRQIENWMQIDRQLAQWRERIDDVVDWDRKGKVQLIQYNPVWDERLAEFGPKLPVSADRDKLYGLATYLLAHGDYTYFGFGRHPYGHVTELWFDAMKTDLGHPLGPYRLLAAGDGTTQPETRSVITNGGFEDTHADNLAEGWKTQHPVAIDTSVKLHGKCSIRITSENTDINNFGNQQYVTLKPNTTYTLMVSAKTENVQGKPGAQVYPYEFEDAQGCTMLTWNGTHDWKEQRLVFTTGKDTQGRITFRMYGATGTVWLDDIRLVEGQYLGYEVYAREYSQALVLVKPYAGGSFGEDTATHHRLPMPMKPLRVDGSAGAPVETVSLRNAEAVILLK